MLNTEAGIRAEEEKLARRKEKKKSDVILIDDDAPFFSKKKNIVKLIAFVVFLAAAVFFITRGIALLIHKDPGWYEVECDVDKDVPYYSSDCTLIYDFEGDSSEIGSAMKSVKSVYSTELKRCYKLFDARVEYEDTYNIASVNAHPGEWVELDPTLYDALRDAEGRADDVFDLFCGAFADIRDLLVYSDTPTESDPLESSVTAQMLEKYGAIKEKGTATLEFDDEKRAVKLTPSQEILDFIKEYELSGAVLDFDNLRAAYILDSVSAKLIAEGWCDGYLNTTGGISVLLPGVGDKQLLLYSEADGEEGVETVVAATVEAGGGTAAASFRIFPRSDADYGFYKIMRDGRVYYRNCYMSDFEGDEAAFSALAVSYKGSAVNAANAALRALRYGEPQTLEKVGGEVIIPVLEKVDNRGVIYTADKTSVTLNTELGYKFEYLNYK